MQGGGEPNSAAPAAAPRDGWTLGRKWSKLQHDDTGRRSAMSINGATVLPLRDYRAKRRPQFFTRSELNQLLGLYSRNVSRGVWRDYAIDHREGRALFSVFRHSQEAALYTIVKSVAAPAGPAEFAVMTGRQKLCSGSTLGEALDYFRGKLALVAAGRG
ncbi:MAG TPA: DUF2794 domain-containing protein [Stellaceae bacterium]|nr:DUF2794 domain-containing protein [Stellaceae bacterium]